ncbi:MAG: PulJ/GspJ family protein [Nocardioides sp.]
MSREAPRDQGFTMVEMLVSMALFGVLGTVLLGFSLGSARVADGVQSATDVTEEARLATERMTRELRQAEGLSGALVSDGNVVAMTIQVDFDGSGTIDTTAVDPEVLTYRWLEDSERLTLTANNDLTRPVLAGGVELVDIRLRSSQWIYDGADASEPDGTTTWQELDASSIGNRNGQPDAAELPFIDLVSVELVVRDGDTSRRFTVQADMRNRGGTA